MNRQTDQALRSLLPTHNGPLPAQLADLASSLVAQSRHRASTLRADEEIARAYACAHIACERLKVPLNLPDICPLPPIQPRVYKRLHAHLATLLKPTGTPRRDATKTDPDTTPARAQLNAGTPTKTRTPGAVVPRGPVAFPLPPPPKPAGNAFPPWLRPTVRFVCHEQGYALLAPTMMAGLATIYRTVADEARLKTKNDDDDDDDDDDDMPAWLEENATALVAALYLYCLTSWREVERERAARQAGGAPETLSAEFLERQFQADEKAILGVFDRARSTIGKDSDRHADADAWTGWADLHRGLFRHALEVVSEQGWLQADWYKDIETLGRSGGVVAQDAEQADGDSDDDDDADADDAPVNIPAKAWRSDGMFQARYDLLSTGKQHEYAQWRAGLLASVSSAMEVDV